MYSPLLPHDEQNTQQQQSGYYLPADYQLAQMGGYGTQGYMPFYYSANPNMSYPAPSPQVSPQAVASPTANPQHFSTMPSPPNTPSKDAMPSVRRSLRAKPRPNAANSSQSSVGSDISSSAQQQHQQKLIAEFNKEFMKRTVRRKLRLKLMRKGHLPPNPTLEELHLCGVGGSPITPLSPLHHQQLQLQQIQQFHQYQQMQMGGPMAVTYCYMQNPYDGTVQAVPCLSPMSPQMMCMQSPGAQATSHSGSYRSSFSEPCADRPRSYSIHSAQSVYANHSLVGSAGALPGCSHSNRSSHSVHLQLNQDDSYPLKYQLFPDEQTSAQQQEPFMLPDRHEPQQQTNFDSFFTDYVIQS